MVLWVEGKSSALGFPTAVIWVFVAMGFLVAQLALDGVVVVWLGSMIHALAPGSRALRVDDLAGAHSVVICILSLVANLAYYSALYDRGGISTKASITVFG